MSACSTLNTSPTSNTSHKLAQTSLIAQSVINDTLPNLAFVVAMFDEGNLLWVDKKQQNFPLKDQQICVYLTTQAILLQPTGTLFLTGKSEQLQNFISVAKSWPTCGQRYHLPAKSCFTNARATANKISSLHTYSLFYNRQTLQSATILCFVLISD